MSRRPPALPWRLAPGLLAPLAAGCESRMSSLHGASDAADRTATLGWAMIALAALVFVIVAGLLVAAARRNRARAAAPPDLRDPGTGFVVWGGVVFPGLALLVLFVVGLATLGAFPNDQRPVYTVRVTGHQWWWEVRYLDRDLSEQFVTANELHVPVGQPVRVLLETDDVIHSFWVPGLQGKLDLIPGTTTALTLQPERAGTFRGQCAEFCGAQHAHMALEVVAEPPAAFASWLAAQRQPAAPPRDSLRALGEQLFVGGPCAMCHTVRGTPALAQVAPDLTHFGSRHTIAAGTLPNTLGHLEAWIANAQALKPGAKMPTITQFNGRELRAVAAYVHGLQ